MKSLICLFALLCVSLTISSVTAQIGDQRLQLLLEYWRPFWRRHRARIVPYVWANPAPLWRLAKRSVETEYEETSANQPDVVACIYAKSKLFCDRNDESVECEVEKKFMNPLLDNFVAFAITPKKEKNTVMKFNLLPKRINDVHINAWDFKRTSDVNEKFTVVSIHPQDLQNDEGFTVKDEKCWFKMYDLLNSSKVTKSVEVEKINSDGDMINGKEEIIANLLVLD